MLLQLSEQIATLVQPFADVYADSKPLMVTVTMFHLGGLLAGGGLAIGTDRAILRTTASDAASTHRTLNDVRATHKFVIPALAAIILSGLAFLAADFSTFIASPVYWLKMVCVGALLLNGLRMVRTERALQMAPAPVRTDAQTAGTDSPVPPLLWARLRQAALTSIVLWFVILSMGVLLANS